MGVVVFAQGWVSFGLVLFALTGRSLYIIMVKRVFVAVMCSFPLSGGFSGFLIGIMYLIPLRCLAQFARWMGHSGRSMPEGVCRSVLVSVVYG